MTDGTSSPLPRAHIVDLWGLHEALIRLGFRTDDIYVQCAPMFELEGRLAITCLLKVQGREFRCVVAELGDQSSEAFAEEWLTFIAKATPLSELELVWRTSKVGCDPNTFCALIGALAQRGFEIPTISTFKLGSPELLHKLAIEMWGEPPLPSAGKA